MKTRFFTLFLCLVAVAAFVGCSLGGSDSNDYTPTSTGTIKGNLQDESGAPVPYATVTNGSVTAGTDGSGNFTLTNVAASAKVRLTISKGGYLPTYAFEPIAGGQTAIATYSIRAIPAANKETKTFNTNILADRTIAKNATVEFAKDSLRKKSDKTLVATSDITVVYTQPTDAKALDTFPGIFAGIPTGATTEVPFETFGFIYVDLGSDDYELDPTKKAKITMPIDPKILAAAPAKMPFWSYNVEKGQWIQVGEADKVGSDYVTEVDHFSWYNLDKPITVSRLEVTVASYTATFDHHQTDTTGTTDTNATDLTKRVVNARVVVTASLNSQNSGTSVSGFNTFIDDATWQDVQVTNSQGIASFDIPKDRMINISVTYGDTTTTGYGYEIDGTTAKSFINMAGYSYR